MTTTRRGAAPGHASPARSERQARGAAEPGPVLLVAAPGSRPFHTVAARWAEAVGRPFGEVEHALGAGRFIGPEDGRRAPGILVIDQLEEIFTHCEDTEERELFIRAVAGEEGSPGRASGTGPRIVLGLRADYFGHCSRDPRLSRVLRAGQFTVPTMSEDELRSAIERPAAYAGLRLEDGLSDLLLRELHEARGGAGDAIALPFLAHALQETWAGRRGTLLTFGGYQATGGIGSSVARVAERIHGSLDAGGRRELRELCLRMVRLVDGQGKAVRRRVRTDELGPVRSIFADQPAAVWCRGYPRAVQATGEHRKAEDRRCGWPGRTWATPTTRRGAARRGSG
ncbi:hypothetical protein ACFXKS_15295 [Streptomyces scopuliridis]|uniref:nSTAND1 domain-containing NTPase n=1 Tax=Streptomyces scopuliridis TaxID=452529 RepID=UPI00367DCC76